MSIIDNSSPIVHIPLREHLHNAGTVTSSNTFQNLLYTPTNTSTDIKQLKQSFQSSFTKLANDKKSFYALLDQAFGTNYDRDAAEGIRNAAINGDFSWLPEATVLDNDEFSTASLNGGNAEDGIFLGAFDKNNNSILINDSVLSNEGLAKSVYAEETGHALDHLINRGADAKGDEGAIFSKLLSGEVLTTTQLDTLRSENDHGVVAGKEVEFYSSINMVFEARDNVFALAYHDVATGRDDIGSKNPLLNNAKYREDLLVEKAKAYANDPTNEKKDEYDWIRDLISNLYQERRDGREIVTTHDGSGLRPIVIDYNKHVNEEAKKGNFLLASNGYTFFNESDSLKGVSSGRWLDVSYDSFKNNPKVTLAFAHDDVARGVDGAVEREQRLIAEFKKGTYGKEYENLVHEIADPHLAAKVSGQDAEQLLRNYELNGWVTQNIFELLSHDVELGQEGADNLKTRLTDTYRDKNSDPEAFTITLREATLRYKGLNLEEVNQRVSKGLGFGSKVQELAENSPESLKEFIQFNYEKVNEELVKRGLPTVELKPGFTDELITKLTSGDATIKADGQRIVAEMFSYVEQLDISTQIEGHTSYKKFQAEAQAFGTMLSGLDDDALEGYINTFMRIMNEQNPSIAIDYGKDPVGTIADILSSSNSPEKRLQLESIYATWKQQVGGNEAAKTELNQIVAKQSFSDKMVSVAKQSDRAYYDVAKIIFGIGEGADFTPEQRVAADSLLANIKAGDPATYKNALNDAYELVKSLDNNGRKALGDRYNAFLNDKNSEQKLLSNVGGMAENDPEAYHAFAKKLLAEEYNYEAVENFRLNGSNNEEVISGIYDRAEAQPDDVKAELSAIVAKYNFMQTLTVVARNDKDTYHQSLKNFLASQQENPAEFQYDHDQFELARQNLALGDKRTFEELVPDLLAMVGKTDSNALSNFNNDLAVNYVARENKQSSFNAEMRSLAADDAAFTDYAKTIMGEDFPDASIKEVKENLLSGNTETSFKASSEILDKINQLDSAQKGKLSKIMTGYNFLLMLKDLKDHDMKAYDKFVDKLSIEPVDAPSYDSMKTIYQSLEELPDSVVADATLIFSSSLQERNLKAGLADALTNFSNNKEGLQHFISILQADRGFVVPEGVTLESIMSIMGGEDKDAKATLVDKVFPAIKGVSLATIQAANDFTIDTKKREKSREMLVLSLVQMQETDEKTLDAIIAEISDEPAKVKQLLQDISNTQGEEKTKLVSSFADILAPLWEEAFTSIVEKVNASSQWVTFKEGLILQASDKDAFHANAKIFTGDGAYNPEQVEAFRNQLLAIDENDEKAIDALLRPVYEERLTNSPESIDRSLENMQEHNEESLFRDSYFPMAGNKEFFHKATKQLLDDPRSAGTYNEAEVEAFRLNVVKAFGADDRAALDQLMEGKYEIVKDVNQSTSNAFIQTHKEFLIDNQTRGAYKSLVEKLAGSEVDFHSYVKTSMGEAYSDEMKSTVEEWRISIRDKKEGYEGLISAGYDYKINPENATNTAESDRILDAFELKDTLVELSKNDEYFLEYVGKYLQASSPGSSYSPAEIKTIAEDIKAKIKTEGHAALTGVYGVVASFDKDTKEALLGVINKDRVEANFKTDFSELAKTPEKFNTLMQTSFGESYNKANAEDIRVKAAAGDFSWMPKVEVLKQDVFAKASLSNGDQASNTLVAAAFDGKSILLNEAILSDSVLMDLAFKEEMGHSLDKTVNGPDSDAKGEEGEIFRRLFSGEKLGAEQLALLRAEDDSGVLAGKNVEFFSLNLNFGNTSGGGVVSDTSLSNSSFANDNGFISDPSFGGGSDSGSNISIVDITIGGGGVVSDTSLSNSSFADDNGFISDSSFGGGYGSGLYTGDLPYGSISPGVKVPDLSGGPATIFRTLGNAEATKLELSFPNLISLSDNKKGTEIFEWTNFGLIGKTGHTLTSGEDYGTFADSYNKPGRSTAYGGYNGPGEDYKVDGKVVKTGSYGVISYPTHAGLTHSLGVNISDNLLNINFNSKIKQGSDDFDFGYSNKLGVTYKESFQDETLDVTVNATFNSTTGATDGKGNNLANTWFVPSQQKYKISYQPELSIWKFGGSFTNTTIPGKPGKPDQDSSTVGITIGNGDLGVNVVGSYTHTTIGDKGYDSWGGSLVYDTGVAKFSLAGSLKEGPKVNGLEGSFKVEIPWSGLQ